jgi:signal transduction histidine kinase
MRLRQRLAVRYGAVVAIAILLLGGLSYHEFQTEERLRAALPPDRRAEAAWGDSTEIAVYALIPLILVAGWWVTRRSLQPLSEFAHTVEQLDIESLHDPLVRTGSGDEVDRLAASFNTMAGRLDDAFRQVREFTLHASHELKTPLTVMRGEIETMLLDARSCSPEHLARLESVLAEVGRLTTIVDGLALLTKADAGQLKLERRPVPLAELVREAVADAEILAEPAHVRVSLLACDEITIVGDRHRLRQLMLNLVDNAIKYNIAGGVVDVALRQIGSWAEIEIANTGSGIPESLRARVFDRFVRGDEARRKAIDGCGLGLSIARWVVEAHKGTIELTSNADRTIVRVRLPIG